MQFLSPLYLLGAFAVAAPILIHLIRRRKETVVAWAAHRFLVAATRKLQKRRRVEDLLLLLLRCLLFLLLALLFARPFFPAPDEAVVEEGGRLVLLVDASASMGLGDGVKTVFDRAKEAVDEVLAGLPESTGVSLILFGGRAYPLVGAPTSDHDLIRGEMARQHPLPETSNLAAGLSAALRQASGEGSGKIVLITDGQAEAWSDAARLSELARQAREASVDIVLRPVEGRGAVRNLGVAGLELLQKRPVAGQALRVRALVRNGGPSESEPARLLLEKEEGVPFQEAPIPALAPGEVTAMEFTLRFEEEGAHLLTARLPGDTFPDDDRRSIGLQVASATRVGIVEGRHSAGTRIPPGFFLSAAAVPVDDAARDGFPVEAEVVRPDLLRDRERLAGYDVLVLTGIRELDTEQAESLRDFLDRGGGLWINPPSDEDAAARFVRDPVVAELIGGAGLSLDSGSGDRPSGPPYAHPVTAAWNDASAGSLEGIFADRYLAIAPTDTMRPVLRLRNGDLLFATSRYRKGRVFLSALPMDGEWSNLPLAAPFVPLVQRSLDWLSGVSTAPREVAPGESWSTAVDDERVGRSFHVRRPGAGDGVELAGKVEFRDGRARISFSNTRQLGRYELFLDPDGPAVGAFGVNLPPSESDLRAVEAPAADLLGGETGKSVGGASASPGWWLRFTRALPDLTFVLAVLILIAALLESHLAHRFSRPR